MYPKHLGFLAAFFVTAGCNADQQASEQGAPPRSDKQSSNEITCAYPVRPGDSGTGLLARYGENAKTETLPGPEGTEFPGVVLWGSEPSRRVDVYFEDEALTRLVSVEVADRSTWMLSGISVGDTLERLRELNGKPIKFYGFEWDYGGAVIDLGGGALDDLSGCRSFFKLGYDPEAMQMPEALIGDREVSSDEADDYVETIEVDVMGVSFQD